MPKRKTMLLILVFWFVSLGVAQQTKIEYTGIRWTPPTSGEKMYAAYCAACHGQDLKGGGPAAPALKVAPANLTTLSQTHGGKFPSSHVATVLQFGTEVRAHGNEGMPVWGPSFAGISNYHSAEVLRRISRLSDYLASLQQPK